MYIFVLTVMSYLTLLLTHNKDQDGNPHGPFTVAEEEVNTININDLLPAFGSTDDFRGVDPTTEAAPFHVEVNRMLMPKLKWSFWTNRSLLPSEAGQSVLDARQLCGHAGDHLRGILLLPTYCELGWGLYAPVQYAFNRIHRDRPHHGNTPFPQQVVTAASLSRGYPLSSGRLPLS